MSGNVWEWNFDWYTSGSSRVGRGGSWGVAPARFFFCKVVIYMPFEIVTIPFNFMAKAFHVDDLNGFCLNKKVVNTKIEFFRDEKHAYWTVFIEYETLLERSGSEPKGLTEAGGLCYEKLRQWRRETAEKEGIPPFVIAKNSHLVEIIRKEIKTLEALKQINGFGSKKVEKYGKDITDLIRTFFEDNN